MRNRQMRYPSPLVIFMLIFLISFILHALSSYFKRFIDDEVYYPMEPIQWNQSKGNMQKEARDWRPKWSAVPRDQWDHLFTDYEQSAFKAIKAFSEENPVKADILRNFPCEVEQGLNHCCPGSSTLRAGPFHTFYQPWRCRKGQYDIRMDVFQQRPALTTHDVFWNLPNDSNVILIGDSVNFQIHDAFGCDIIHNNHFKIESKYGTESSINYTVRSADESMAKMDELQPNWKNFGGNSQGEISTATHRETLSATLDGKDKFVEMLHIHDSRATLRYYRDTFCEWGNVFVLNWALWYHPPSTQWEKEIGHEMFKILQECFDRSRNGSLSRKPIFIWYEMTPQHQGGTVGGYWYDPYRFNDTLTQQYRQQISNQEQDPELLISDTVWEHFWSSKYRYNTGAECREPHYFLDEVKEKHLGRQRVIDAIDGNPELTFKLEIVYPDKDIERTREDTLYFIPMKDALHPLWFQHRNQGDCCHWCSTPFLWDLMWDSMARIIQKNT